jgi:rhamnose utilization protein RhaD (predicted bifunctional aldolase and dehydrogenase)
MKSLWNEAEAGSCTSELALRAYSSRLLGRDESLVLYGGGNTSLKTDNLLYVKGSGSDLGRVNERDLCRCALSAHAGCWIATRLITQQ